MITPKGFVLLAGAWEWSHQRASCCWREHKHTWERGRTQSTQKQTNLQGLLLGPLAHVELSCSVVSCLSFFCGVVSLFLLWCRVSLSSVVSCLSLLWTMCMCWREHKVSASTRWAQGRACWEVWEGEACWVQTLNHMQHRTCLNYSLNSSMGGGLELLGR